MKNPQISLPTQNLLLGWDKTTVSMISDVIKEPAPMADRRLQSFSKFKKSSWPTLRHENWRHTDPYMVGTNKFLLWNSISDSAVPDIYKINGQRGIILDNVTFIQLVNGTVVNRQITKPFQLRNAIIDDLRNIGDRWNNDPVHESHSDNSKQDALSLMFDSFFQAGTYLSIPANTVSNVPIYLSTINRTPQGAMFYQNFFRMQRNSDVSVILHLKSVSDVEQWLASKTRIMVEDNATFNLLVLNETESNTYLTEEVSIEVGKDAKLNVVGIDLTKGWSVISRNLTLNGTGCEVKLNEAHIGSSTSHTDLRTTQKHMAKATKSDLLYKTAMFDNSHSVFQGMINIQPEAANSNAYQMNRNLLLGKGASTDSIPKLEIAIDEVRCSHGATAGLLDKDVIFYLMSRGMTYKQSIMLLLDGFLKEVSSILGQPEVLGLAEKKLVDFIRSQQENSDINS